MVKTRTVLMVVENRPAPSDARVWPEALALRDAGFTVCVISPKGTTKHRERYVCIDSVHVYRFPVPTGTSALSYLAEYGTALLMTATLSLKVWRKHRFDVIHVANPPDIFFPLAWIFRPLGVRFVFDQHDLAPETFMSRFQGRVPDVVAGLLRRLLVICERWTYRAADLVVVTNESFRQVAMARGGRSADEIVVVRNGPDLNRLRPVLPEPELKEGRTHLLAYVGEMAAQDGVDYAVRALGHLVYQRGRRDVGLVLLGDGSSMPELRELTHKLGLDEYVSFTGWVSIGEVVRYLSVADVGLSPEPRNAMNDASTMIKTMEYMAMGLPIVAFDLRETRFSAREAALYATPNSVEDFASKIEELLDDQGLRHRMGAFGRTRVEDDLSWEHSRAQLLEAYGALYRGAADQPEIKRSQQESVR